MQPPLRLLCLHVITSSVSGDFYGGSGQHRKALLKGHKRYVGDTSDFHVDAAWYESAAEGSNHPSRDVTKEVNKMIRSNSLEDLTHKRPFLETFGEIAYGEQKRLRLQKGNVVADMYENDSGNAGQEEAKYVVPQEIRDAEEDPDIESAWDAARLSDPHITVDRAIISNPDDKDVLDVTDRVNMMIRMHGTMNFTDGRAFKSLGGEGTSRKTVMEITVGNLTMDLQATQGHEYNIPEALITEAKAKIEEQAMMEVTGKPSGFACRRPSPNHHLWEGPASLDSCASRCRNTEGCMFYSTWDQWCRLTPSCARLQAIPGRSVLILADETKKTGCSYRCQGLDLVGVPRCRWKLCTGCTVCKAETGGKGHGKMKATEVSNGADDEAGKGVKVYVKTQAKAKRADKAHERTTKMVSERADDKVATPSVLAKRVETPMASSENVEIRKSGEIQCPGKDLLKLGKAEVAFAKCPPRSATPGKQNETAETLRTVRLQTALCAAKRMGWTGWNDRESSGFEIRGYATFESASWPKDPSCRVLPDEVWSEQHKGMPRYRPDTVPKWMPKYVNEFYNLEFHENWKVASNSFPNYLKCEYGNTWVKVPNHSPVPRDRTVAVAVRNPIDRFVSAASELLERAVNRWCPSGPCNSTDAFDPENTIDLMHHTTTWLPFLTDSKGGYTPEKLPLLMQYMVKDAGCNYATYASEHLSSQANFVTQNAGPAAAISVVVKLEHIDKGLQKLANTVGKTLSGTCAFEHSNVKEEKPFADRVPSSKAMMTYLHRDAKLMRALCMIYAQDFICFDYALPAPCEGLF